MVRRMLVDEELNYEAELISMADEALHASAVFPSQISLSDFIREGWHVLEPGVDLIWNWHIDAICQHLEAVKAGQIRKLLINIAPGTMKSLVVSVFFPAWMWLDNPEWRCLSASYERGLATRDTVKSRDLILSDWFQESFSPKWQLSSDQNVKEYYKNTQAGERKAVSVGGATTGFRGDAVLIDDPLNVMDQYSEAKRKEATTWLDQAASNRLRDPRKGAIVIIMQRLHEADPAGHVLEQGGYEHLCLPTKFEIERKCATSIGWTDPRSEHGELLFPAFFTPEVVAEEEKRLGSAGFAGQHQQQPSPSEGNIFKKHWWKFWHYPGNPLPPVEVRLEDNSIAYCECIPLPDKFDEMLQSWDMAFKDLKTSDFVVGQVWGRKQANRFLRAQVRDRLSFPKTCDAVIGLSQDYPQATAKLIEDKANGPAVIAALKNKISGLIGIEPDGGKEARAHAVSPQIEAGNVYLPHPYIAPWIKDFIERHAAFPTVNYDDEIDALTQALRRMEKKKSMAGVAPAILLKQPRDILASDFPPSWARRD